jgi:predicted O-linked N-acetylglucosamine transferase (SPINDLY family)
MSIDNTPLTEELAMEEGQEQQKKIETMEDAVHYAYGLSETRKEIEEINRLAEMEIEKWQAKIREVEEWRDSVIKPLQAKADYMSSLLMAFHMEQYYSAPNEKAREKLKSIKLPYGVTLKSTQPQVNFEIKDEERYKQFMEKNGFIEHQEPKLKWGDFKKTLTVLNNGTVITKDGEVVDFLRVVPQERKFEVK